VLTLHGTDIEPFLYENEFAQRYTQAIEGIDSLTTVSHAHARRISKESGLKKDIEVIPNFIPLRDFSPTLEKPPLEQPQIIHISNFRQIKNISDVIQTFELILRHIPNAELCLVGDGESMEEAERYARKAGLIKTIRFPGLLKDIPKALVPAHLMLAASQYESFGLVFLEAMACGVPVIAPDIGGIPEVIRHGQTGYLFPPGDYRSAAAFAVNILENKEEYRKVSQRAIIHSQLFGPERAITQYENVYSHILT
jgi:N-acetyl-alpha-D-glucosaminyl L-malate synthase BshA